MGVSNPCQRIFFFYWKLFDRGRCATKPLSTILHARPDHRTLSTIDCLHAPKRSRLDVSPATSAATPPRPAYKISTAPLVLSHPSILLQVQNLTQPISDYNLIQFFHIEMASSSVLLGAAGAAVLTGTSAGKAVPRPSFLAARPRTVTGGRLCLQTPPRASPVCVASVRS
jgi:hypothetical protein